MAFKVKKLIQGDNLEVDEDHVVLHAQYRDELTDEVHLQEFVVSLTPEGDLRVHEPYGANRLKVLRRQEEGGTIIIKSEKR